MNDARGGLATGANGSLWLIDWRGSERGRAFLREAIRLASRFHAAPTELVIYSPGGGALDLASVLPKVPRRSLFDALPDAARRDADSRTLALSRDLISLDAPEGLGLGDRLLLFNALDLQEDLRRFELISALCRQAASAGIQEVRLFTLDSALAKALVLDAVEYGLTLHASRLLSLVARMISRPAKPVVATRAPESLPPSATGRTLIISWTRPMDVMMHAVHAAARRAGLADIEHLHHAASSISPLAVCEPLVGAGSQTPATLRAALWAAATPRLPAGGAGVVLRASISAIELHLPRQEAHFETVTRRIAEAPPRAVVVGNDRWWVGSAWVLAARTKGIPTFCLQDGIAADMPQWRWLTADRIGTNGRHLKRLLEADGFAADRSVIVGQPRYDAMRRGEQSRDVELKRKALALPSDRPILLFATQYGQDAAFVRRVVESVLRVPQLFLVLRPHPSEDQTVHHQIAAATPRTRMVLAADVLIDTLLQLSDIVMVQTSSVAFEADILGRQLLLVDFTGQPIPDSFVNLRGLRATDDTSLERHLTSLAATVTKQPLPPPDDPDFLGPLDGECSARAVAEIQRLLAESERHA